MSIDASNTKAAEAAQKVREAIKGWVDQFGNPLWGRDTIANAVGAVVLFLGTVPTVLFGSIFGVAADIVAAFLDGITEVRNTNTDRLNNTLASALTEVLGITISASDLPSGTGGTNNLEVFRAIGTKVLGSITKELGGNPSDTPGPGELGAAGFMGFGLNFSVNAGLLGLISELASFGFIKGLEELAQEIQHTLGFGRLMRLAVQPVMHTLVTVPYTRELNARYTPTQLTARELLAAFNSGRMQEDEMRRQMAQHGYSSAYIDELILQLSPRLTLGEVDALVRWGDLPEERGIEVLAQDGVPAPLVRLRLDALHRLALDRQEHTYASEVLKLAQERFLPAEAFTTLLSRLHMTDDEKQVFANRLGVYLDSQTKRLTLKELLYLAEHNLITQADIDKWAADQGYNQDAAAMLDLWVLQQELDYDALQKAKAARAARKKPPAPPTPAPGA